MQAFSLPFSNLFSLSEEFLQREGLIPVGAYGHNADFHAHHFAEPVQIGLGFRRQVAVGPYPEMSFFQPLKVS